MSTAFPVAGSSMARRKHRPARSTVVMVSCTEANVRAACTSSSSASGPTGCHQAAAFVCTAG